MTQILEPLQSEMCLLHMDFRRANILAANGRISGVIDWSNALIGHPALELCRIAEYGELSSAFLVGYQEQRKYKVVHRPTELLCRLDTAIMLGVVFLSEAPDRAKATRQMDHICKLMVELKKELAH